MAFHFLAVTRILRYLKGTITLGIKYTKSDADWVGGSNNIRSTTGLIVFLRDNPVSWASKQQIVSRSSTEAKYRALSITASEIDSIQQLFQVLHMQIPHSLVLFDDNLEGKFFS